MRLKPGSLGLTIFIGFIAGLGPMSTDMYLPAMPAMTGYFGASRGEVQATLTAYLFGYAFGQIFYGPISDRIGRKAVLGAGLMVYALVSLVSVFLPTVELLIAARFVQAVAAAAPIVLGRAIIRDLYSGEQLSRQLALVVGMMGILPMISPVFGSLLQVAFGWQSIFLAFSILGGLALLLVWAALPETLQKPVQEPFSAGALAGGFAEILRHRGFRAYVAMVALIYAGLFTFIAGSPFILQERFGLGPIAYGLIFGTSALTFMITSAVAARLNRHFGGEWVLAAGTRIFALGGLAVLGGAVSGGGHFLVFMVPVWLLMIGIGLSFAQAISGGLAPFGHRAGTASSVIGTVQSASAAAVVLAVSAVAAGSHLATGLVLTGLGLALVAVFQASRRVRLTGQQSPVAPNPASPARSGGRRR